eukprot:3931972-Rhodomonas_salina.1
MAATSALQHKHIFNLRMMYGADVPEGAEGLVPPVKTLEFVFACVSSILTSLHVNMESIRMAEVTLLSTCMECAATMRGGE